MPRQKFSENVIQEILWSWLRDKSHEGICPNTQVFGWEADMVSTTTSGYAHEYEIKISRADFRADKKKVRKHKQLVQGKNKYGYNPPNYFWYVAPAGIIPPAEVPAHAGLMVLMPGLDKPKIIKKAPRLHTQKISCAQLKYINRGLMCRYWSKRRAV